MKLFTSLLLALLAVSVLTTAATRAFQSASREPSAQAPPLEPSAQSGSPGRQTQSTPQESDRVSEQSPPQAYELPCALTPDTFLERIRRAGAEDGSIAEHSCFLLMPGDYILSPSAFVDSTCGNCQDPAAPVEATVGLVISGVGIVIEGSAENPGGVVIHTGAGYGLLFEGCKDCVLRGVTITDGVRDPDGRATDAAIVVKNSTIKIENCIIRDNIGDPSVIDSTVVGIMGIAGREGASIDITDNQIIRNSWDGIALYHGARAAIFDNVIDGIDKAAGEDIGGGRGVGIGVTWDAKAHIEHNLVRRYWKGIGVFVDAQCDVIENVVEEVLTWGIAYWDAGMGSPVARIEGNLIYNTGACGITIARRTTGEPAPGQCVGNVIVRSGLNPKYDEPTLYCAQCPISVESMPEGFIIERNYTFYNRRVQCGTSLDDLTREEFARDVLPILQMLSGHAALGAARAFAELDLEDED